MLMRNFLGYQDSDGEKYLKQFLFIASHYSDVDEGFVLKFLEPFGIAINDWIPNTDSMIIEFKNTKTQIEEIQATEKYLQKMGWSDSRLFNNREISMWSLTSGIQ